MDRSIFVVTPVLGPVDGFSRLKKYFIIRHFVRSRTNSSRYTEHIDWEKHVKEKVENLEEDGSN